MKKKLKWLLLGSLMCFVIGSGFQASYGMLKNEEIADDISWQQKALKVGISQVELKKVKNEFYTYQDIVIGYEHWNKFVELLESNSFTDQKPTHLSLSATNGCELAIKHLLWAYRCGCYGLTRDLSKAIRLAEEYADKGSQVAKDFINDHV